MTIQNVPSQYLPLFNALGDRITETNCNPMDNPLAPANPLEVAEILSYAGQGQKAKNWLSNHYRFKDYLGLLDTVVYPLKYQINQGARLIGYNWPLIAEDLADCLSQVDTDKFRDEEALAILEQTEPHCKDEAELTTIAQVLRKVVHNFQEFPALLRSISKRLERRLWNDKTGKDGGSNDPTKLRLEIAAYLAEHDLIAKTLLKTQVCRAFGLDKKTFELIAESLDNNSSKPKAKRLKLSEFMSLPTTGTPLLAPGIAGMGVTLLAGSPGCGKTTLAYDLAGSILLNEEFLGELPNKTGPVLIVSSDEPHQHSQDKLINRGIAGLPDGYLEILYEWDVSQWATLEQAVEDIKPVLIIVDSFNAIHNSPDFDENCAQASQSVKKLERLSAQYCASVILIHHTGKSKDNRGVNKVRGSTAIAASVSSVLLIEGDDTKQIYQPKIRGAEPINLTATMDTESGRFTVISGFPTDPHTKTVVERLKAFYTQNPGMYERSELNNYFPDVDRKQLTNALNKLLGTQIHGLPFCKRPSKLNLCYRVYGVEHSTPEEPTKPSVTTTPHIYTHDPASTYDTEAITHTEKEFQSVTTCVITPSQPVSQPPVSQPPYDTPKSIQGKGFKSVTTKTGKRDICPPCDAMTAKPKSVHTKSGITTMPSFVIPRAFPGLIVFVEQYPGVEITVTRLKSDDGEWFYGQTGFWADDELFHLSEIVGIQQSIDGLSIPF